MRPAVVLLLALVLTGCSGGNGRSEGERFVREQLPPSDGPSGQVCLPQGSLGGPGATPEVAYDCATVPPDARLPLPTPSG